MKKNVDPCDDFYEFVCGNYEKRKTVPDDQAMINFVGEIYDRIENQLKRDIEEETPAKELETFTKLRNYYHSCIDQTESDDTKEARFLKILEELGSWPLLAGNSWDGSSYNWTDAKLKFRKAGFKFDQFISIDVRVDSKNHTRKLIHIDGPSLGIGRDYLVSQDAKNTVLDAYFQYMIDYVQELSADLEKAVPELRKILRFERDLAKISPTQTETDDTTQNYNLFTIEQLTKQYPTIPWLHLLNGLSTPSVHLENSDQVILTSPRYLTELIKLMANTPNRTLANYAYWRVAQTSANYVSRQIHKLARRVDAAIYGVAKELPRSTQCIIWMSEDLPIATGAWYVRRHFNTESKQSILTLFEKLRGKLRETIMLQGLLDDEKSAALEKLDHMIPLIAYPDELFDNKILDKFHENMKVSAKNFFKSMLSIQLARDLHMFKSLKQPVNRSDWTGGFGAASVVNAFYRLEANTIEFPAGILQAPVFNTGYPNYMNYGAVGSFLGHEMSHGFVNSGRAYGKYGQLKNSSNYEKDTTYLEKAECIIAQLGNGTVQNNTNVNPGYVEESIADIGGLEIAYSSYQDLRKINRTDPRLPGLEDYSPEQMFWIANGNMWCTKYRPETLNDLILSGTYLPADKRILGSMSNQIGFSQDFQCSEKSRMNPSKKCSLWL
ncbi:hypothetical protein QAD02_001361 [Eretmocerus hayati]|uniref:Uncharacterized protein n=1 Tax=Eretmocerus hayati TaxID=131215 RepID=A0ACC2NG80_9HYME|nr:hypothetical protein QAD02_001361 [Eretmocerus hayati]